MYKAIIVSGIVAVCLAVGCGGGNEETATTEVTRAQFIKQAKAICNQTREEARDAAAAWEKSTGKKMDFNTAFKRILGPLLNQEASELQSLAVPEAEEVKLARLAENLSKVAAAYTGEGEASKLPSTLEAFEEEARGLDLDTCSRI